jgi:hypothetical protein
MSAYVPLLTITDDGDTTTIVVANITMWNVSKKKDKTTIYLKSTNLEVVLDGDFSKQLTALYYP